MNKPFFCFKCLSRIIAFLTWSVLNFSYSPRLLAMTQAHLHYSNCAELQKRFNDKNPESRFQGFEKANMQFYRSMPFQSVYASTFVCDGGTFVDTHEDGIKRVCSGYIRRYVSPYSNDQGLTEKLYSGMGKYEDRWNGGNAIKRYCRQVRQ